LVSRRRSAFGSILSMALTSIRCSTPASALCCLLLGFNCCLLLLLGLLLLFLACLWCHFFPLRCRSSCVPTYHVPLMLCCGAPASLQCQTARYFCIRCASAILSSVALFSSRVWSCSSLSRRVHIYFQLVSLYFVVCFSFFRLLFYLSCHFCHMFLSVFAEGCALLASAGLDVKEVQSVSVRGDRVVGAAQARFGPCYPR